MNDNRWLRFAHWATGKGFNLLGPTAAQIATVLYSLFDTHGLSPQTIKRYRTYLDSVLNHTGKAKVVQNRTISDMIFSIELQRPRKCSEQQALVFHPKYIQFKPKGAGVTLYFIPEFIRKLQKKPNQVNDPWYIPAVPTGVASQILLLIVL